MLSKTPHFIAISKIRWKRGPGLSRRCSSLFSAIVTGGQATTCREGHCHALTVRLQLRVSSCATLIRAFRETNKKGGEQTRRFRHHPQSSPQSTYPWVSSQAPSSLSTSKRLPHCYPFPCTIGSFLFPPIRMKKRCANCTNKPSRDNQVPLHHRP